MKEQLRTFQKQFIRRSLAPGMDVAALSIPRGNGKPGTLTTMARLSQWALENGYLDSERGKDSSEPLGDQPKEPGAAPGPRSNS